MKKTIIAGAIAASVLCSCAGNVETPSQELIFKGDTVTVSSESSILTKLSVETLAAQPFSDEFRTVGTVQAENGRYAEVGVPFDGRISRSFVSLGSKVSVGQALFEFSSPEFLEASKDYFQSVKNYEKAKADYERKKELLSHGITSQRELEESMVEAENARHDMEYAESTLRVYGTDPKSMQMGQSMKIVSPISGEVVRNTVTTGAFTKADSEPLVTIADLRKVWITALVKERFIGSVQKGGLAEIITEADPEHPIPGTIVNVGNLVDEETRSIQVVVSCDNADMALKHGMYVSVHFLSQPKDMIVLPSTAVFQGETSNYVYACTDRENVFVRKDVVIGSPNDDNSRVSIVKGLKPGDKVISEGGLYLNN